MVDTELVSTWRGLLARYHSTWSALDRALREHHQLGASEFEVLEQLAEMTPEGCGLPTCRMQELGTRVQLSQSALSRVVGKLESDGLVERTMCADDRRGIYVALTEHGRQTHTAAQSTHRAVLAANLV